MLYIYYRQFPCLRLFHAVFTTSLPLYRWTDGSSENFILVQAADEREDSNLKACQSDFEVRREIRAERSYKTLSLCCVSTTQCFCISYPNTYSVLGYAFLVPLLLPLRKMCSKNLTLMWQCWVRLFLTQLITVLIMSSFIARVCFYPLGISFLEQLYGVNNLGIDHYLYGWKGTHFPDHFSFRLCFMHLVIEN